MGLFDDFQALEAGSQMPFEALLELERNPGNDSAIAILDRIRGEFDEHARMMVGHPLEDIEAFAKSEARSLHLLVDGSRLDAVYIGRERVGFYSSKFVLLTTDLLRVCQSDQGRT